jgi:hypothetical protein
MLRRLGAISRRFISGLSNLHDGLDLQDRNPQPLRLSLVGAELTGQLAIQLGQGTEGLLGRDLGSRHIVLQSWGVQIAGKT